MQCELSLNTNSVETTVGSLYASLGLQGILTFLSDTESPGPKNHPPVVSCSGLGWAGGSNLVFSVDITLASVLISLISLLP